MSTFGLAVDDAGVRVAEKESADFEAVVTRADGTARVAALQQTVINVLFASQREGSDQASPNSSGQLADPDLIAEGTISGKIAKEPFEIVRAEGGEPRAPVAARHDTGHRYIRNRAACRTMSCHNPDKASQAKTKPAMIGWFVGQVMKASGGKANPQTVNALLKAKLDI